MKKNYENVEINVISLEESDVITASGPAKVASSAATFGLGAGATLDLGGLGTQSF